ncbi:MAG TPA: cytochrome c peroxidase, partial [Chitinophagaceae bacterium]|nr:cytochrome c peroxidase [Chitinophagaceae bacterium]
MRHLLKTSYIITAMVFLSATGIGRYWRAPTPLQPVYPAYFGNRLNIPANNPMTEEGVRLGRMLFYETALSSNNRFSCASCHRQELAFTDGKQFSPGFDGTPTERNSMSLANLLWVRNFFWDGRAGSLEMQAETPLTHPHEMGQSLEAASKKLQQVKIYPALFGAAFGSDTINGEKIVRALAQFERTLISANSAYDKYLRGEYRPTASEMNGIHLFFGEGMAGQMTRTAGCGHCHGGPKTFLDQYHNNGLDSMIKDSGREKITGQAYDRGRFRVATLRNIALTAPYMHDGRFNTLEEVVD